jgi:hypothetical protein
MNSSTARVIALIGAALLGYGNFLPIVNVPKRGPYTLMDVDWAGIVLLGLVAIIVVLALVRQVRHVVWPGLGALVLLGYAYQRANAEIARSRQRLGEGIGDDPFGAVRDLVASNATLEYGWAVLALGAILVVAAGAASWLKRREPD